MTKHKDNELRELVDGQLNLLGESDDVSGVAANLMQLIEQRDEQVAREARIDEVWRTQTALSVFNFDISKMEGVDRETRLKQLTTNHKAGDDE